MSVPIVEPLPDGDEPLLEPVLLVFGDAPMLPLLGAVLSDVLGAVVLGDAVLGDVVLGDVVLGDVVLGDVVLGDVVLGDVVLGDVVLGDVESLGDCAPVDELGLVLLPELDPVPLACAYTRPAATASATLVPAAMVLNLLMDCSYLEVDKPSRCVPASGIQIAAIAMPIACARGCACRGSNTCAYTCVCDGFNACAWASRRLARRWRIPSIGCTGSSG